MSDVTRSILVSVDVNGTEGVNKLNKAFQRLADGAGDAGDAGDRLGDKLPRAGKLARKSSVDFGDLATKFRDMGDNGMIAGDALDALSTIMSGPVGLGVAALVAGFAGVALAMKAVEVAAGVVAESFRQAVERNDLLKLSAAALKDELGKLQASFAMALVGGSTNASLKVGALTVKMIQLREIIERNADTINGVFNKAVNFIITGSKLAIASVTPLYVGFALLTDQLIISVNVFEAFRGALVKSITIAGEFQSQIIGIISAKLKLAETVANLRTIIRSLVSNAVARFKELAAGFKSNSGSILTNIKTLVGALAGGIMGLFNGVKDAIMKVLGPAITRISGAFKKLGELVARVGKTIAEALGLDQMAQRAKEALAALKGVAVGFAGELAGLTELSVTKSVIGGVRAALDGLDATGAFLTGPGGAIVIKPEDQPPTGAPAAPTSPIAGDLMPGAGGLALGGVQFAMQAAAIEFTQRQIDLARVAREESEYQSKQLAQIKADIEAFDPVLAITTARLKDVMVGGVDILTDGLTNATHELTNFLGAFAVGESTLSAFGDSMADLAGSIANTFGDLFIKQGAALFLVNPGVGSAMIAAGLGLKVLGGALTAKGSANRGGGGGGRGVSPSQARSLIPREDREADDRQARPQILVIGDRDFRGALFDDTRDAQRRGRI